MKNPWCYTDGGRGIDVGYVATPFPGYHQAPWRDGVEGKWETYDGQRLWFEKDVQSRRLKFSPQVVAEMTAIVEERRKKKRNKILLIGGAAALALWKLFA